VGWDDGRCRAHGALVLVLVSGLGIVRSVLFGESVGLRLGLDVLRVIGWRHHWLIKNRARRGSGMV